QADELVAVTDGMSENKRAGGERSARARAVSELGGMSAFTVDARDIECARERLSVFTHGSRLRDRHLHSPPKYPSSAECVNANCDAQSECNRAAKLMSHQVRRVLQTASNRATLPLPHIRPLIRIRCAFRESEDHV